MEFGRGFLHGEDPHSRGEVEVEGAEQGGGRMVGGKDAGGHLAKGVDAAVGPTRSGDVEGFPVDFFQGGFEGELDGGMGILALPAEEVGAEVGDRQLKGLEFKGS